MINILILINLFFAFTIGTIGCSNSDENQGGPNIQADIAGRPAETQTSETNDPLKKLQDEGRLPPDAEGRKLPVLPSGPNLLKGSGPEVLSLYPLAIDPDRDGVPDVPIVGHPEIKRDNCPGVFNPGQEDRDGNGIGDACQH